MIYLWDLEQVLILYILYTGPVLPIVTAESGERSGSVVESLTRDGGPRVRASPASLCCVLEQDTLIQA